MYYCLGYYILVYGTNITKLLEEHNILPRGNNLCGWALEEIKSRILNELLWYLFHEVQLPKSKPFLEIFKVIFY
jgi:hypothetical protein